MLLFASLSDTKPQSTGSLFIALGLAVASPLLATVITWLKERDARTQRSNELDEAIKIVSFWESWLKNIESLKLTVDEDFRLRAQTQMFEVSRKVEALAAAFMAGPKPTPTREQFLKHRQLLSWWRKCILIYRPAKKWAWAPRVLFYAWLVSTVGSWFAIRKDWAENQRNIDDAKQKMHEAQTFQDSAKSSTFLRSQMSAKSFDESIKKLHDDVNVQQYRINRYKWEQDTDLQDLVASPLLAVFLFFIARAVELPSKTGAAPMT